MNSHEIRISETLISRAVVFLCYFFCSSICHTCLAAWWFWIMLNNSPSAISRSKLEGSAFRSITFILRVFHVCNYASLQDQTFNHGFILLVISRGIEALWSFVICVCNMNTVWRPFSKLFYSSLLGIHFLLLLTRSFRHIGFFSELVGVIGATLPLVLTSCSHLRM